MCSRYILSEFLRTSKLLSKRVDIDGKKTKMYILCSYNVVHIYNDIHIRLVDLLPRCAFRDA